MKKTVIILIAAVMLLGVIVPATLAWLNDSTLFDISMTSYLHKSYFESGDGTGINQYQTYEIVDGVEERIIGTDPETGRPFESDTGCAFEIKYPVQLYYFAWLQYMGYFNQPINETTNINQTYFYLSADLDMTGWTLPPIGTSQYPFVGNFDGNGHIIRNLTVFSTTGTGTSDEYKDLPVDSVSNVEIAGFFGVIGSLITTGPNAGKVNAAISFNDSFVPTAGYSYDQLLNSVVDFTIDGVTIETETDSTLIGAIAGYVNGTVSNTAVSDTDIIVDVNTSTLTYTDNISDYSLVGYCTDPYKFTLNVSKVTLHAPGETQNIIYKNMQGEGAGFGGSIDMKTLHSRLTNVAAQGVIDHDYVVAETLKIDLHTGKTTVLSSTTAKASTNTTYYNRGVNNSGNVVTTYSQNNDNNGYDYYRYLYYYSDSAGSYYIQNDVGDFMCLYGENAQYTKTVTKYTYLDEFLNGFKISNGGNYLNASRSGNNAVLSTGTDEENATIWVLDNSGHLNALIEFDSTVTTYYLNADTTSGNLSVSTTATTTWTKNGITSGSLTYSNGRTWYLIYDSGWKSLPFEQSFTISNGANYLGRYDTAGVVGNSSNAAHWVLENGSLVTYANGRIRYLNSNSSGELSIGTSATTTSWSESEGVYSCTVNGDTWYLLWTGTTWEMFPSTTSYLIHSGNNYFGVTNNDLSLVAQGNAVRWIADGYKLYTPIGGTKYYLVGSTDGSGDLSLTTTKNNGTDWTYTVSGGSMTYSNGQTWYLYSVDGNWRVYPSNSVTTISQNGNYLGATSDTTVGALSSAWIIDGSGHIYTYYNGAYRYLVSNGTNVYLNNSASTVWTVNNDNSITNGSGWYLVYEDGWKCYPSLSYVILTDGTNYLSKNANTGIVNSTSPSDATRWFANGNKLFAVDGVNTYYLRGNGTSLSATTDSSLGSEFSYDSSNKRLSYVSGTTYYVVYNNNWVGSLTYTASGPISSGGSYLNANTTSVSRGTNANSATQWTFNSSTGKIYATISGNTYYLRGLLAATQTRSTTNLTVTTNANDSGTTWSYSNNNLSCNLTVDNASKTFYLCLENNTWKLMDLSRNYYTISNRNSYYLNTNGNNTPSLTGSNSADQATLWNFSDENDPSTGSSLAVQLDTVINGNRYYLRLANNSATITTTVQTVYYYRGKNGYYIDVSSASDSYDLSYSSQWTTSSGSSNNRVTRTKISFSAASITISGVSYVTEKQSNSIVATNAINNVGALTNIMFSNQNMDYIQSTTPITESTNHSYENEQRQTFNKTVENNVKSGHSSYLPLAAEGSSPFTVKDLNTGYIVSGANITHNQEYQRISGDIRISRYNMVYLYRSMTTSSYSSNQLNQNNYNFTFNNTYNSRLEILTGLSNGTYTGFYRISDEKNKNNSTVNSSLSDYTKVDYKLLGYKRYEDARASLEETFLNQDSIYGLHFMDAQINIDHLVRIPEATIEYETYENYPVPEDCIDFHVKRRGFITVFAGTYFTGNNAFFSLHEIFRDENNEITAIKEISKIYKAAVGSDYIYQYSDGTYSSNAARGTIAFDMSLMTNPSQWVDNTVYYFEIPVNSGEFALGSVSGKTGAYLFYLDIAANAALAEDKDRVTITEKYVDESYSVVLPKGVQLVESGESYDSSSPYEIVTVELKDGYNGSYSFVRTGDEFTYTTQSNVELTYLGDPLTASGSYTYMPNGYEVQFIEHVTDYGRDTNNYDHILIKTIDSYDNTGTRTTRTVYVYADILNLAVSQTVDESDLDLIVTFTYNPSGHDSMKTRVVRASSEGGFNISFDENVTLTSVVISSELVHVNFGDNTASTLITASTATPLSNNTAIPLVNMSGTGGGEAENVYYASVYGDALASYTNYYEGENVTVNKTTEITMPKLDYGNSSQSRTLTYAIILTPESGVTNANVYAKLLINPSQYTYNTKVLNNGGSGVIDSTVTVTVTAVTINETILSTSSTMIALPTS